MSDIKDLGQIVIHKNTDRIYERFAISGIVDRKSDSYKTVRKQEGVIDYQGLDSITLFKKDLDGNIFERFTTTGWQTVANGYAEVRFEDFVYFRTIVFAEPVERVRITIQSVYEGDKWQDTAISAIMFPETRLDK